VRLALIQHTVVVLVDCPISLGRDQSNVAIQTSAPI
jgi:hypothetical protein